MGDVIELVAREKTYTGREVAELLGIGVSTLRKWSMLLEQHGYRFLRDNQNRREYRQIDVVALQRFYRLTKDQLFPQEEAAEMVISQQTPERSRTEIAVALAQPIHLQPDPDDWEDKLLELATHVQKQDAAHQELLARVERQEAYIRSTLKERDRRLTKAMNDIMDTKIQLARMKDEQRSTSIWHRLFRIH